MTPLKIYLGDLNYNSVGLSAEFFPLNIGYIAAYCLKQHGVAVNIRLFKYIDDMDKALRDDPPDVLGLSNYPWCHNVSIEMFRMIAEIKPDCLRIMGGPNFPHDRGEQLEFLRAKPEIDSYVYYEGEVGFSNLIDFVLKTGSLREARSALQTTVVPGCIQLNPNKELLTGSEPIRLKKLDEIPSPYLSKLLDKFFDGKLVPFISTNRGCPFSCTFCADGTDLSNRINHFSVERVKAELRYIAERTPKNVHTLAISDLNFGMYPRDVEIVDELARLRKEFNYPSHIDCSPGKNSMDRIIANVEKLGGAMHVGMSVQSLDPIVLKNIKRSNIKFDDYQAFGSRVRGLGLGLKTVAGVILMLPGETYESHIKTLRLLLDSDVNFIVTHSLILLHGSELATTAEKQRWSFKTRFRVLPRGFGKLRNGRVSVEVEEVVVGSSTLSTQEYIELRKVALLVSVINNNKGFLPLIRILSANGINLIDIIQRILANQNSLPPKIKTLIEEFQRDTVEELWDSPDRIREFFQKEENYQGLLNGKYGKNLIQTYFAMALSSFMDEWFECIFANARSLLREAGKSDICLQSQFEQVESFCRARAHNLFGPNRMDTSPEMMLNYDIQAWMSSVDTDALEKFKFEKEKKVRFVLTSEQYKLIQDALESYGDTLLGRSRMLVRVNHNMVWRTPQFVE